jgi:hypothetical protein
MAAAPTVAAPASSPGSEAPASTLRAPRRGAPRLGELFDDQDLAREISLILISRRSPRPLCKLPRRDLTGVSNPDGARLEGLQLGEADLTGVSLAQPPIPTRADPHAGHRSRGRASIAPGLSDTLASALAEGREASFRAATGSARASRGRAWEAVFDEPTGRRR